MAVAILVRGEAVAQIPVALNGFPQIVYNLPPLPFHKSPAHFYRIGEAGKNECRNNEGSLVPCAHAGVPSQGISSFRAGNYIIELTVFYWTYVYLGTWGPICGYECMRHLAAQFAADGS